MKKFCSPVWVLALTAISIPIMGHNFATGNQVIYLLWIERLRDPLYLANDWYLSTTIMHPNILYPLRFAGDWLGDANAFLAAMSLSRLFLVAGAWNLARALGGSRVMAAAAAFAAVFTPRVSLGAHYLSGAYFEASHMGMGLATLSLANLVRRKFVQAGLWLGVTIHIHLFLGAHVAGVEALAALFYALQDRKPNYLRDAAWKILRIALPAFILSAWTLWGAAEGWSGAGDSVLSGRDIVEILAFRHPHHHSPLSWRVGRVFLFIVYVCLGLVLSHRALRWREPVFRALHLYAVVAIVVGTVFVEWIPVELVALFQFFRMTVLLLVWASVEVGLWLGGYIEDMMAARRPSVRAMLSLLAVLGFRVPMVCLPASIALLALEKRGDSVLSRNSRAEILCSNGWMAAGIVALLAGIMLTLAGARGWLNPLFELVDRENHFRVKVASASEEVETLAQWVDEHTPNDAIILASPNLEGFSVFARRAMVVTFKQVTFTRPELHEWINRVIRISLLGRMTSDMLREDWGNSEKVLPHLHQIRRLGQDPQVVMENGYAILEPAEVRGIATDYGATIFITPSLIDYPFPLLGTVGDQKIYEIK